MKRLMTNLFVLVVTLFFFTTAHSAFVDDLYQASIKIDDQSLQQQRNAAKKALAKVLVKISGNRQLLADDEIKKVLNRAEDLLLHQRVVLFDVSQNRGSDIKLGLVSLAARDDIHPVEQTGQPSMMPLVDDAAEVGAPLWVVAVELANRRDQPID